jgi:hypothetical protein
MDVSCFPLSPPAKVGHEASQARTRSVHSTDAVASVSATLLQYATKLLSDVQTRNYTTLSSNVSMFRCHGYYKTHVEKIASTRIPVCKSQINDFSGALSKRRVAFHNSFFSRFGETEWDEHRDGHFAAHTHTHTHTDTDESRSNFSDLERN